MRPGDNYGWSVMDGSHPLHPERPPKAGRSAPGLDGVGRRLAREALLESLLHPSRAIAPEYRAWVAQTADGRVASGILVSRDDLEIVLRDAAGLELRLATATIEALHPLDTSLMPEHLFRDLTPQQASDLLAYLESLR